MTSLHHPHKILTIILLLKECIFCGRTRKRVKGKEVPLDKYYHESPENSVKNSALALMVDKMLAKIGSKERGSTEVE